MKVKKLLIPLLVLIICIYTFAGCGSETVIDRLKNRYGVDTQLLTGYEIVCDISGKTFTGYAPHYAVIQFRTEPTEFLQSYTKDESFYSEKNEDIKAKLDAHSDLEIPNEFYPNWDDDYIWRGSGVYMIYFPNDVKLIVFETGH